MVYITVMWNGTAKTATLTEDEGGKVERAKERCFILAVLVCLRVSVCVCVLLHTFVMLGRPRTMKRPLRFIEEESDLEDASSELSAYPSDGESSSDSVLSDDEQPSCSGHSHGDYIPSRGRERCRGPQDSAHHSPPHQRWKTLDDPDEVAPTPPRFFPKRPPGVQLPFNLGNPSPGEIFSKFVDAEVLQHLVECTNKKAAANQEKGKTFVWTTVSTDELKKFIGLLLYMSVVHLPQLSDYWRQGTIFHQPHPATVMSRDRFRLILSNLHMSDPKADAENDAKKGMENYDPIHRVRLLLDMVRIRCLSFYHPKQHLAVDERMVATKARLGIKQYMKAKPTKRGLKLFVLADVNGYTVQYLLYTGKGTTPVSGNGLSFDVVVELVKKEHLGTGYIIYMDNFNTSPLLFRHLIQEGFGVCGTYREGRIGVPKTRENALDKRASRGSIRWIRDGDLLFIKWKDSREVSLCSSVHPVYSGDMVERWQKTGEQLRRVSIPRPTAVTEYNKYMGGVDTSTQMLGTRSVHRKTKRWTITVFQHLVDICVTNSYIIHKEVCANQQQAHMTRQQFQEELAAHLLGTPLKCCPPPPPATHHYPDPTSSGNPACQRSTKGRRICKLCKRCTSWMCKLCNAPLCLQPDRNCFKQFHIEQSANV